MTAARPSICARLAHAAAWGLIAAALAFAAGCQSSSSSDASPKTSAPGAPTGVVATPGTGQVQVSWNPVAGASSYNVYPSFTSGTGKATPAYPTTGTSLTFVGLNAGIPVYAVVTAVNSYGESAASVEVTATPTSLTAPTAGTTSTAGCSGTLNPTTVNDPLYPAQWHLALTDFTQAPGSNYVFNDGSAPPQTGADINQLTTTATGCGVKVAVVDTGLEIAHEDLAPNMVPGASSNFVNGGNDPTPTGTGGDHGTAVAGLIGARANNGLGGRGVAGEASLVGYNYLSGTQQESDLLAALGGAVYSADVQVFNQSFGPGSLPSGFDTALATQLAAGVSTLRGGKGAIYVKAAGNSFDFDSGLDCTLANAAKVSCGDANMDGDNLQPYNLVVGAINAGTPGTPPARSSYSSAGSALWISAPGGEFGGSNLTIGCGPLGQDPCSHPDIDAAMVTTDLMGCNRGYAVTTFNGTSTLNPFNLGDNNATQTTYNPNCNYTSTFNGTSSATPVTAGAIAVLLQANPALTWRDVRYILAKTATQVDAASAATVIQCTNGGLQQFTAMPGWGTNAAGFHFHPWYGFGRVDVDAAVALATTAWTPNGFGTATAAPAAWTDTGFVSSAVLDVAIPDCAAAGVTTAAVDPALTSGKPVAFIETVQVTACVTHSNAGQLQLELHHVGTGATAVFLPGQNGFNGFSVVNSCQTFLVNQFYGLDATGGFTLTAKDTVTGLAGILNSWTVRVYGH